MSFYFILGGISASTGMKLIRSSAEMSFDIDPVTSCNLGAAGDRKLVNMLAVLIESMDILWGALQS